MSRQGGATVVEYALIVAFVAMAVVAIVLLLGQELNSEYNSFVDCMQDKTAEACK
jgi:Flp pilus assembly pilin Flp